MNIYAAYLESNMFQYMEVDTSWDKLQLAILEGIEEADVRFKSIPFVTLDNVHRSDLELELVEFIEKFHPFAFSEIEQED